MRFRLYSVLTIGDGLISQIPALLISITAGIIVTRVNNEDAKDLGTDIGNQIMGKPKALLVGGILLLGFAAVPGFPTETFLLLAMLIGGGGFLSLRRRAQLDKKSDDGSIPAMSAAGKDGKSDKPQRLEDKERIYPNTTSNH